MLAADSDCSDKQLAAAQAALALSTTNPERLLDLAGLRASGDRAAGYEAARKRLEQAAFDELALRDKDLLQELLDLFAAEYAAAKQRESALDFEDLQLLARDLLRDDARVREQEQLRFRALMVDEFQDTNRLQCELIDLLCGGSLERDVFFVGDEFQSIYGFRHADVDVFRERREAAAQRLPLARNYRSRPEVLAAVNHLFREEFGDGYQPLAASGEFTDPVFGHPVELHVTDKRSFKDVPLTWRDGEAKAIARRVRELVDAGVAAAGEIVLLFAAGTDAERYEAALRAEGLPDVSRDRARVLRPAAGRRPARVPAAPAQPLRRRGARDGARVAVRRRLERRARPHPQARGQAAALHGDRAIAARGVLGGRRAPRPRVQAAVRAARRGVGAHEPRAPVRRDRLARTTTTSRCSRSGTGSGATPTCAS